MPMIMFSFLEQYDLSGKTIVPFCTFGSGGLGDSIKDLKKAVPKSFVLKEYGVAGNTLKSTPASEMNNNLTNWLKEIKLISGTGATSTKASCCE
jgi:flavodoxin